MLIFACSAYLGLGDSKISRAANDISYAAPASATNGVPNFTKKTGLRLFVNSSWAGTRGYRPLEITLTSAKPATGDTQVTIRFGAGRDWQQHAAITIEKDFELQQGASEVSTTVLVPQYIDWNFMNWEVWVDGKKDEELSCASDLVPISINNQGSSGSAALFLTSKNRGRNFDKIFQHHSFDTVTYSGASLPEEWKHYSCLDLVVALPEDLKRLSVTAPSRFAHLLRWVRSGGNLWVINTGPNYEELEVVEKALRLQVSDQSTSEESFQDATEQRGWQYLPLSDTQTEGMNAVLSLEGLNKLNSRDAPLPKDTSGNVIAADSRSFFVARGYGMGAVVAFPDSNGNSSFDLSAAINAINQSLISSRIDWNSRHYNDPSRGNNEFGKFLIPDVGTAPVLEFQLLISLFVIGIGPLNYWLLRRRHQLPLMLLTVPVAALVTTVLLFSYGFLADGFGVRVRVRSLTIIDQRLGEAVSWARLSYYAGLAPSQGLTLPDDTLVYPILPARSGNPRRNRQDANQEREVQWGSEQKLTRGWLASRTPTQYLSIGARPSTRKISFQASADKLTATNQLGTKILTLIVRDHDGNFYLDQNINVDQTSPLQPSELIPTVLELRKLIADNEPMFPAGLEVAQSNNRWSERSNNYDQDSFQTGNLLDNYIDSLISPMSSGIAPGSYIAITAEGPEISLGLKDISESSSFHVIRGTWTND